MSSISIVSSIGQSFFKVMLKSPLENEALVNMDKGGALKTPAFVVLIAGNGPIKLAA